MANNFLAVLKELDEKLSIINEPIIDAGSTTTLSADLQDVLKAIEVQAESLIDKEKIAALNTELKKFIEDLTPTTKNKTSLRIFLKNLVLTEEKRIRIRNFIKKLNYRVNDELSAEDSIKNSGLSEPYKALISHFVKWLKPTEKDKPLIIEFLQNIFLTQESKTAIEHCVTNFKLTDERKIFLDGAIPDFNTLIPDVKLSRTQKTAFQNLIKNLQENTVETSVINNFLEKIHTTPANKQLLKKTLDNSKLGHANKNLLQQLLNITFKLDDIAITSAENFIKNLGPIEEEKTFWDLISPLKILCPPILKKLPKYASKSKETFALANDIRLTLYEMIAGISSKTIRYSSVKNKPTLAFENAQQFSAFIFSIVDPDKKLSSSLTAETLNLNYPYISSGFLGAGFEKLQQAYHNTPLCFPELLKLYIIHLKRILTTLNNTGRTLGVYDSAISDTSFESTTTALDRFITDIEIIQDSFSMSEEMPTLTLCLKHAAKMLYLFLTRVQSNWRHDPIKLFRLTDLKYRAGLQAEISYNDGNNNSLRADLNGASILCYRDLVGSYNSFYYGYQTRLPEAPLFLKAMKDFNDPLGSHPPLRDSYTQIYHLPGEVALPEFDKNTLIIQKTKQGTAYKGAYFPIKHDKDKLTAYWYDNSDRLAINMSIAWDLFKELTLPALGESSTDPELIARITTELQVPPANLMNAGHIQHVEIKKFSDVFMIQRCLNIAKQRLLLLKRNSEHYRQDKEATILYTGGRVKPILSAEATSEIMTEAANFYETPIALIKRIPNEKERSELCWKLSQVIISDLLHHVYAPTGEIYAQDHFGVSRSSYLPSDFPKILKKYFVECARSSTKQPLLKAAALCGMLFSHSYQGTPLQYRRALLTCYSTYFFQEKITKKNIADFLQALKSFLIELTLMKTPEDAKDILILQAGSQGQDIIRTRHDVINEINQVTFQMDDLEWINPAGITPLVAIDWHRLVLLSNRRVYLDNLQNIKEWFFISMRPENWFQALSTLATSSKHREILLSYNDLSRRNSLEESLKDQKDSSNVFLFIDLDKQALDTYSYLILGLSYILKLEEIDKGITYLTLYIKRLSKETLEQSPFATALCSLTNLLSKEPSIDTENNYQQLVQLFEQIQKEHTDRRNNPIVLKAEIALYIINWWQHQHTIKKELRPIFLKDTITDYRTECFNAFISCSKKLMAYGDKKGYILAHICAKKAENLLLLCRNEQSDVDLSDPFLQDKKMAILDQAQIVIELLITIYSSKLIDQELLQEPLTALQQKHQQILMHIMADQHKSVSSLRKRETESPAIEEPSSKNEKIMTGSKRRKRKEDASDNGTQNEGATSTTPSWLLPAPRIITGNLATLFTSTPQNSSTQNRAMKHLEATDKEEETVTASMSSTE